MTVSKQRDSFSSCWGSYTQPDMDLLGLPIGLKGQHRVDRWVEHDSFLATQAGPCVSAAQQQRCQKPHTCRLSSYHQVILSVAPLLADSSLNRITEGASTTSTSRQQIVATRSYVLPLQQRVSGQLERLLNTPESRAVLQTSSRAVKISLL